MTVRYLENKKVKLKVLTLFICCPYYMFHITTVIAN